MMQKLGKIGYYAFLGFLGVIAFAIAASVFPITGNFQLLVVQSGSMEPSIKTGGLVVIKPAAEYNVGDVITFGTGTRKETAITHRIYEKEVDNGRISYVTKGDANDSSDSNKVLKEDVIGKVLFSVPFFGYVVDFAKKPMGFALIIGVPATLIIGDEVRKISTEVKSMARRKKVKTQSNEKN
ncbi:signal peptidase I [Patescibacteria group bacterium]|nr:signal peptidase I [Patescibacteria group bacterium]